jgi:hypothetical protein
MIKPFKFFQNKKDRVFTDFMDALDDYHLLGTPSPTHHLEVSAPQIKRFNLNVMGDILRRIPSYEIIIVPNDDNDGIEVRYGTVEHLINGSFNIPWCFTELTIRRGGETQDTFTSYTIVTYNNVDEINSRGWIFDLQDRVIIKSKLY